MAHIETESKPVDMAAAQTIQSKVAEWSGAGNEIFQGDSLAPYTEGFYDNCVVYWIEDGYDEDEVRETVRQALAELAKVYGG